MRTKRISFFFFGLGGLALVLVANSAGMFARDPQTQPAGKEQAGPEVAFFNNEVLPVLKANCFKCHGDDKVKASLSLSSRPGILKGGESGPAISLEKPETSLLLQAINHVGEVKMPPSPAGKLDQKDIDILTRWVKAGAPGLPEKAIAAVGKKAGEVTAEDRQYWAYKPVKKPGLPTVKNKAWVRNGIDNFILAGLEAKGLHPTEPADRLALGRRVYFDLIGLPPTPEQLDEFVNDQRPDAYEKLVDKLLAMPQYGEKWARHWLDLVRYGETNGFEFDVTKPMIWRYRDYIIDVFNQDKPYDQFIREQIAGDMLPNSNADTLIATGYYRVGQWDSGAADRTLQKYEVLDSIMSTTGQVFLGMSMGCVRCHDHKADPILHKDYYRMLAFFHNISDFGAKNTKSVKAPVDKANHEKYLKEKQDREIQLAREIYELEQKFAVALAAKKGLKITDLPLSDMIEVNYKFYRDTWEKLPDDFEQQQAETEGPIANNYFTLTPASRLDAVALVFEGKLKVLQDGEYTFNLDSTDGARLIIDGKTVLDRPNKGRQSATEKVKLKAGLLSVRLEWFNRYDMPMLRLDWSGPGFEKRMLTEPVGKASVDLAELIKTHGAEVVGEKETKEYAKLVADLQKSRNTKPAETGIQVSAVVESGNAATYVLIRGNPNAKADKVDPGFPEVLLPGKSPAIKGGRLALANWLADPANPLPARVMMNRFWQHHFGRGIVPTPNDFGKFGEPPTHPELLDWLASEFVARGWKMKDMNRLIMTSSTYRMSSKGYEKALTVDPANNLMWRYNMRRLSAEEIRDTILLVSGKLNLKMGGPGVMPPISKQVLAGQARPGNGWKVSSPEEASRRSVYIHVKRSLIVPILEQFDLADTDQSCPVRFTTTVPTQALGMLNDDFTNEQAKFLAQRLKKEAPQGIKEQITRAIRLTTARTPTAAEVTKDLTFVQNLQKQSRISEAEAMRFYCLMVLNANEFLYLD
ncbi:MAG TPA: DUF1553 domain-containing protein [Gemmataceae bacterium]|nr:DUF1553 domain-containing protein [Gemmataceae bacterium]